MIYLVLIINLSIAYFLSKNDNFFKATKDKLTYEFNDYFSDRPINAEFKLNLVQNNKYQIEISLFVFAILGVVIVNIGLSYLAIKLLVNNEQDFIENIFKILFADFVIVISTGGILNKFKESYSNFKKIKNIEMYEAFISNEEIYFPFFTLEGAVSTEISKTRFSFVSLPLNEIAEFSVEPSQRVTSISGIAHAPPYFKIAMKNKNGYIYVLRSYFSPNEKIFINALPDDFKAKIIFNDELK